MYVGSIGLGLGALLAKALEKGCARFLHAGRSLLPAGQNPAGQKAEPPAGNTALQYSG